MSCLVRSHRIAFSGLMLALLLPACALHRAKEDRAPPVMVPERFSESGAPGAAVDRWWEAFGDPGLDAVVEQALSDNLDLVQAWARLAQAEAIARQAGAAQWPEITLETGASRSKQVFSGGRLGTFSFTTDSLPLTLGAAYEVDLWKRISSLKRGAILDMEATRQDLCSIAMTLAAQVTETWFSFLEQTAQCKLLAGQERTSRTFLELTRLRFSQGLASALDVYQQGQQLAATRANRPQAESLREVFRHQLAVLLGQPPLAVRPPPRDSLPEPPPLPPTGLPSDLLTRRPDVRAAQLRLAAADHRIAAAIADRLPALRVGGGTGYESRDFDELRNLFDNWIWSLTANLAVPVFDGGRRKAEVDRTRAVVRERLGAFGQAVLRALQEVEDALIQERKQQEFLDELDRQIQMARASLREARLRYANGLSDYLPVLTALQSVQVLERTRLTGERQLLSYRVQLYRALGGAWTAELEPPERRSKRVERGG